MTDYIEKFEDRRRRTVIMHGGVKYLLRKSGEEETCAFCLLLSAANDALTDLRYLSRAPRPPYARPDDDVIRDLEQAIARAEGREPASAEPGEEPGR